MRQAGAEKVIGEILEMLYEDFRSAQLQTIKMVLYMVLSGYKLMEEETALSTEMDINPKLLKGLEIDMQLRGCTESSIDSYRYELRKFETHVDKSFLHMKPSDVMSYLAHGKINLGWKDTTFNTKLRILRKFFDFLVESDFVDLNPCRKIKEARVERVMRPTVNSVEREIVRCQCGNERNLAILDMLYSTGIRVSELCRLDKKDIDMETMSGKVYGKGKKERIIYFSGQAKVHLQNYLVSRTDDDPALFVSRNNPYRRLGKTGVECMLRKLVGGEDAPIKKLTPHVLRRSIGTDMLNRGAPLELVADKLGHENVDTTRQCYAAYSQDSLRQGNRKYAEI